MVTTKGKIFNGNRQMTKATLTIIIVLVMFHLTRLDSVCAALVCAEAWALCAAITRA